MSTSAFTVKFRLVVLNIKVGVKSIDSMLPTTEVLEKTPNLVPLATQIRTLLLHTTDLP
jgi:hypothetical protein